MSITVALKPHKNPRIDGLTDAQHLRWVLEFIRHDLDGLTADELKAVGDNLLHATAPWWVSKDTDMVEWMRGVRLCMEGMPATQVRTLQQEIREAIQRMMGGTVDLTEMTMIHYGHANPKGWILPEARTHLVRWRPHPQLPYRVVRVREGTDARTAILNGVADLCQLCGDRLLTCQVCGAPFLRRYRQEFCATRCSVKVRNKRRLDRKAQQQKRQLTTV
jgi:hypothetical protein